MEIVTALLILLGIIMWFANMVSGPRTIDVTIPGKLLCRQFMALGDMRGKTMDEIIAGVGPPTSRSSMGNGQLLLQWQATGYHMVLLFNAEGRAVGITHEYANFAA